MKVCDLEPDPILASIRRGILAAIAGLVFASGCTWNAWIPGERNWNPDVVVDPATLAEQLTLGSPYVGQLDCFAARCQKRFRLSLDHPGRVSVRMIPELASQDARSRIVLEGIQGPLGQAGSGPGPHVDPPILSVSETVSPGMYFVLIQSLGGPMPYQLTAHLERGDGPAPASEATSVAQPQAPPPGPLTEVSRRGDADATYDPKVSFETLRTFTFAALPAPSGAGQPNAPLEQPVDRQIRRFLADDLTRKGLRRASGSESADLVVHFSRRASTRTVTDVLGLSGRDDAGTLGVDRKGADTRATLTVELVERSTDRIAWRARSTKALGPGTTPGEKTTALVGEAVTEALTDFPPR